MIAEEIVRMIYKLPKLPYETDALEPYIDACSAPLYAFKGRYAYFVALVRLK